jgi:hypothetical protein
MKKVNVTPAMAQSWLETQVPNRSLSVATVGQYARAMFDGVWLANEAVPIRFDEEGRLADGQHRLEAVIKYGQPVDFFVVTNDADVLDAIHNTKPRTLADRLVMCSRADQRNARLIASLGGVLCDRIEFGRVTIAAQRVGVARMKRRPDEVWTAYKAADIADIDLLVQQAEYWYRQQPSKFRLISATIIAYMLCQNPPGILDFIGEVVMPEHPNRRQSVLSLRRQLGNGDFSQSVRMGMTAYAYNNPLVKIIRVSTVVPDLDGGSFAGK